MKATFYLVPMLMTGAFASCSGDDDFEPVTKTAICSTLRDGYGNTIDSLEYDGQGRVTRHIFFGRTNQNAWGITSYYTYKYSDSLITWQHHRANADVSAQARLHLDRTGGIVRAEREQYESDGSTYSAYVETYDYDDLGQLQEIKRNSNNMSRIYTWRNGDIAGHAEHDDFGSYVVANEPSDVSTGFPCMNVLAVDYPELSDAGYFGKLPAHLPASVQPSVDGNARPPIHYTYRQEQGRVTGYESVTWDQGEPQIPELASRDSYTFNWKEIRLE